MDITNNSNNNDVKDHCISSLANIDFLNLFGSNLNDLVSIDNNKSSNLVQTSFAHSATVRLNAHAAEIMRISNPVFDNCWPKKFISINETQCRTLTADEQDSEIQTLFDPPVAQMNPNDIDELLENSPIAMGNNNTIPWHSVLIPAPVVSCKKIDVDNDVESWTYERLVSLVKEKFVPLIGLSCTLLIIDAISSGRDSDHKCIDYLKQLLNYIDVFEQINQSKKNYRHVGINTEPSPIESHETKEIACHQTIPSTATDTNYSNFISKELSKLQLYKDLYNYNRFDENGNLPFHRAVLDNCASDLLRHCVIYKQKNLPVDVPNDEGMTPLHLALVYNRDINLLEVLLKYGANLEFQNCDGDTAIHLAVTFSTERILQQLLHYRPKTNLDICNYNGDTPLILCASTNMYNHAVLLLENNANPNIPDKKTGKTAIFYAIESNPSNDEITMALIKYNADVNVRCYSGLSVLDTAKTLKSSCTIIATITSLIKRRKRSKINPDDSTITKKKATLS